MLAATVPFMDRIGFDRGVYALPFEALGALWVKVLVGRRRRRRSEAEKSL